tara:strand:+ start:250 stop:1035 length:786 start_codon:yes stop_codon:yes gene_type:complete
MENIDNTNTMTPNYVPEDLKVPYDVLELPSQGLLYPNKKSSLKVEYLTAMDETILTSPNLSQNGKFLSVLIDRKIKDLGFPTEDLLEGDKLAILIWLRATGYGETYSQQVYDKSTNSFVVGEINLTELKQKKLVITPDENGEFEYRLPNKGYLVKFKFTTGKDEEAIDTIDEDRQKRYGSDVSERLMIKLEQQVTEINGERDKLKISNTLKRLPILDARHLRKYISENEPGMDLNVKALIPGGESIDTFLRFTSDFFWPEL